VIIPPPLFNVEKQFDLTIYLCIVCATLFVGGGGNDLVVSIIFAWDSISIFHYSISVITSPPLPYSMLKKKLKI
jgi:hypothetical protein